MEKIIIIIIIDNYHTGTWAAF